MPQIIVTADKQTEGEPAIMFRERVNARDFESEHFARHLAQRLGWAVADAHAVDDELGPVAETGFESQPDVEPESELQPQAEPHQDPGVDSPTGPALSPVVQQAW